MKLVLPGDYMFTGIDWLAIFDTVKNVSLGYVTFPSDLNVPPNLRQVIVSYCFFHFHLWLGPLLNMKERFNLFSKSSGIVTIIFPYKVQSSKFEDCSRRNCFALLFVR